MQHLLFTISVHAHMPSCHCHKHLCNKDCMHKVLIYNANFDLKCQIFTIQRHAQTSKHSMELAPAAPAVPGGGCSGASCAGLGLGMPPVWPAASW